MQAVSAAQAPAQALAPGQTPPANAMHDATPGGRRGFATKGPAAVPASQLALLVSELQQAAALKQQQQQQQQQQQHHSHPAAPPSDGGKSVSGGGATTGRPGAPPGAPRPPSPSGQSVISLRSNTPLLTSISRGMQRPSMAAMILARREAAGRGRAKPPSALVRPDGAAPSAGGHAGGVDSTQSGSDNTSSVLVSSGLGVAAREFHPSVYNAREKPMRWTQLPVPDQYRPSARCGHVVLVVPRPSTSSAAAAAAAAAAKGTSGSVLYLVMGQSDTRFEGDVWRFDIDSHRWSAVLTTGWAPAPRCGHSACLVGTRILMFGGTGDLQSQLYNDIAAFDTLLLSWTKLSAMGERPAPRAFASTCVVNRSMYLFGGWLGGLKYDNEVWMYDLDGGYWARRIVDGEPPAPRGRHSAVVFNASRLIVFGGWNGSRYFNDVWTLDINSRDRLRWQKQQTFGERPCVRNGHVAAIEGNRMWVLGGFDGILPLADVHVLDLVTMEWSRIDVAGWDPSPRCLHSAAVLGGDVMVFGGWDGSSRYSDTYQLCPGGGRDEGSDILAQVRAANPFVDDDEEEQEERQRLLDNLHLPLRRRRPIGPLVGRFFNYGCGAVTDATGMLPTHNSQCEPDQVYALTVTRSLLMHEFEQRRRVTVGKLVKRHGAAKLKLARGKGAAGAGKGGAKRAPGRKSTAAGHRAASATAAKATKAAKSPKTAGAPAPAASKPKKKKKKARARPKGADSAASTGPRAHVSHLVQRMQREARAASAGASSSSAAD